MAVEKAVEFLPRSTLCAAHREDGLAKSHVVRPNELPVAETVAEMENAFARGVSRARLYTS